MKTIAFVGCSKRKQDHACSARDMYRPSTLFSKLCDYIETRDPCDALFILSAKYGLLEPCATIEPYDESLNQKSNAERRAWACGVVRELEEFITEHNLEDEDVTLKFWCGKNYRETIIKCMEVRYPHWKIEIPLQGKGIGEQLHYLS